MSTRGTTYWDDPDQPIMQWVVDAKPWCTWCCVPLASCGCPSAEAELDRLRAQHLDGMGRE